MAHLSRSSEPLTLKGPRLARAQQFTRQELLFADDSFVITLAMDPASAGDARRFAFFIALLEALHRPVVGVLPAASWNLARGVRWARTAGPRWQFKILNAPLSHALEATDLCIMMAAPWVLDQDLSLLRARQAALAGLAHSHGTPLLWTGASPPAEHYPDDLRDALCAPTDEPRKLATRTVALLEDAERFNALRDRVAQSAKTLNTSGTHAP